MWAVPYRIIFYGVRHALVELSCRQRSRTSRARVARSAGAVPGLGCYLPPLAGCFERDCCWLAGGGGARRLASHRIARAGWLAAAARGGCEPWCRPTRPTTSYW